MPLTYQQLQALPTERTPTPNQRSGILVWDVGLKTGRPHAHRNAIEIFYFFQGDCRMLVGPDDRVVRAGEFVVVPPEAPHAFEVVGDVPVGLFLIVTPNLLPSHTPPEDFIPGAEKIGMQVSVAKPGMKAKFPPFLRSEVVAVPPGESHAVQPDPAAETVTFVMRGEPYVTVGPLSGQYPTYGELFVPAGQAHRFENRGHEPVELLISRVTNDPKRTAIDTPFEQGALAEPFRKQQRKN